MIFANVIAEFLVTGTARLQPIHAQPDHEQLSNFLLDGKGFQSLLRPTVVVFCPRDGCTFVLFPRQGGRLQKRQQSEKKGGIAKQTQDMSILRNRGDKRFAMKTIFNQTYMYQRGSPSAPGSSPLSRSGLLWKCRKFAGVNNLAVPDWHIP